MSLFFSISNLRLVRARFSASIGGDRFFIGVERYVSGLRNCGWEVWEEMFLDWLIADGALIVVDGLSGYLFFSKKRSTNSNRDGSWQVDRSFSFSWHRFCCISIGRPLAYAIGGSWTNNNGSIAFSVSVSSRLWFLKGCSNHHLISICALWKGSSLGFVRAALKIISKLILRLKLKNSIYLNFMSIW